MGLMDQSFGPRQLVLALDHAVSFAREDFLGGDIRAVGVHQVDVVLAQDVQPDQHVHLSAGNIRVGAGIGAG